MTAKTNMARAVYVIEGEGDGEEIGRVKMIRLFFDYIFCRLRGRFKLYFEGTSSPVVFRFGLKRFSSIFDETKSNYLSIFELLRFRAPYKGNHPFHGTTGGRVENRR